VTLQSVTTANLKLFIVIWESQGHPLANTAVPFLFRAITPLCDHIGRIPDNGKLVKLKTESKAVPSKKVMKLLTKNPYVKSGQTLMPDNTIGL
jgi:hypothetical protein